MNEPRIDFRALIETTGRWADMCDEEYHRLRRQVEFKKYMEGEAQRIGIQPCQVTAGELELTITCDASQFIGQLEDINDKIKEIRASEEKSTERPPGLSWPAALFLMAIIAAGGIALGFMIGAF